MKTLLLGAAPSRSSDPSRPLIGGHSGTKLQELCGLNLRQYFEAFDRADLLQAYPGSIWPKVQASAAAAALLPALRGRRVVLVGRGVAEAFGLRAPALEWTRLLYSGDASAYIEVAYLPHPSGLNLWWNCPANTEAAAKFMRAEAALGLAFVRRKRLMLLEQG